MAGFEPAQAKPTRFLVMPDNHSGASTYLRGGSGHAI